MCFIENSIAEAWCGGVTIPLPPHEGGFNPKSILFIINTIVLRFYTQVCFVFFSHSFSNYELKTGKKEASLKPNNFQFST